MTPPDIAVGPHTDHPDQWHRLSAWMMAVRPISQLPQLIPMVIAIVIAGSGTPAAALGLSVIALIAVSVLPWLTTRYQVTDDHVRLRTGVLNKKVATARRDRIRSVDLTASAPHRVLGLKKVVIGTGSDGGGVELDCVAASYAELLQSHLMPTGPAVGEATAVPDAPAAPPQTLAQFRPAWLRFAPFSLGGLAIAAAIGGFGAQFAGELGAFDRVAQTGDALLGWIRSAPVGVVAGAAVVAVLLVGAALSLGGYVLNYWGFTLSRHPDATLRVSRGLISTSATTLDENRVRGVHLHEPVLIRLVRGARLFAIATGSSKHPMLLPPAPRDEAVAVAGAVTDTAAALAEPLRDHGRVARRRRLTRALFSAIALAAILLGVGAAGWLPMPTAAVLAGIVAVAAALAGVVRARHLGTQITDGSVIISSPTIARHRFLLDRGGVVGWTLTSSPFQRRQGVTTLVLATAAGSEAYAMVDLPTGRAADTMAQVSPDLVAPFLVDD